MRKSIVALLLAGVVGGCAPVTPSAAPSTPAAVTAAPTPAVTAPPTEPPITPGPTSTPAGTSVAGSPACEVADLKASHGLVQSAPDASAAEVVLVSGSTCSIDASPAFGILDASGALLWLAESLGAGAIDLVPGVAYTSQVRFENWCGPEPSFPVSLALFIPGGHVAVTGSSFPDEGEMPACAGAGDPSLPGTGWELSP